MRREGGCFCGAVRYAAEGEPRETAHCHCRMCQRSAGAAFITWATYPSEAVSYIAGKPTLFRSSPDAVREFCGSCGTQLIFRGDSGATVDITVASLDDPDSIPVQANTWVSARRPWVHGFDTSLRDFEGEWPAGGFP